MSESQRIDKWLWVARFFKSRSLAKKAVELGRIEVNGEVVKPSKDVGVGDGILIHRETETFDVKVKAVRESRLGAKLASELYEETPESVKRREEAKEMRQLAQEPARMRLSKGRPVKKEMREIRKLRGY